MISQYKFALSDEGSFQRDEWGPWVDVVVQGELLHTVFPAYLLRISDTASATVTVTAAAAAAAATDSAIPTCLRIRGGIPNRPRHCS